MKNTATATHASAAWANALRRFDRDLQCRGAGERTRRAYGADVGELARWAAAQGIEPTAMTPRLLHAYGARLTARRMASIRAFYRSLVDHGEVPVSPADLLPDPVQPVQPVDVAALFDRIPATTPLELRDRALFELAHDCGLGAEELVGLDADSIDLDGRAVRVRGRGGTVRSVAAGDGALVAVERYLERSRPALAGAASDPALFLSKSGRRLSTSDVRRRLRVWARHGRPAVSTRHAYTRVESARLRAAYLRSHPRA